ncbi:MAG: hypothetical protein QM308_01365 [Bacillota bacterium]|nr:hypothetical protein [Bacillota bacterium]
MGTWLKILVGTLIASGGAVVGALSRQPEINRLKRLVKQLQAEIQKLQALIDEQNNQINELFVRYKALKVYQIFSKISERKNIQKALVFQYGAKNYLDLLLKQVRNESVDKTDLTFFRAFEKVMNGETISKEDQKTIQVYILTKHKKEIFKLQKCDVTQTIHEIEKFKT